MKPNQCAQGAKPKCRCKWINMQTAEPTPDDNEAIALAVCHDPRSFGEAGSEPFPICEEHAKCRGEHWRLLPLPGQTEAEVHPMVVHDQHRFRAGAR